MLKPSFAVGDKVWVESAAFGRLCVETNIKCVLQGFTISQPPSGGCVLKRHQITVVIRAFFQPPSGGCVLKQLWRVAPLLPSRQPPSGGCVLKPHTPTTHLVVGWSAAFGRLCVETSL